MSKEEIYDGNQMGIIINIPTNTVKLTVIATMIGDNEKISEAKMVMPLSEIYDARVLGDEWETENVKYALTEKGRELLR